MATVTLAGVTSRVTMGKTAAVGTAQTETLASISSRATTNPIAVAWSVSELLAGIRSQRATGAVSLPIETYAQLYAAMIAGVQHQLEVYGESVGSPLGMAAFRRDINKTSVDVASLLQLLLSASVITQAQFDAAQIHNMGILANQYQDWFTNIGGNPTELLQIPLPPPVLAFSNVQTTATSSLTSLVSVPFTPNIYDVIVVKVVTSDETCQSGTPTSSAGFPFTLRALGDAVNFTRTHIYTGIAAFQTPTTITVPFTGTGHPRSFIVEDWNGAVLAATPSASSANSASGTPFATLATVANNSVVSWCNGDWNAVSLMGAFPPGINGAISEGVDDQSTDVNYMAYYSYQNTGSAGTQAFGMSGPAGQKWMISGIEIKSSGGGTA